MAWTGVITNSGKALLAQWNGGEALIITSAAACEGTVSVVSLLMQTDLAGEHKQADIVSKQQTENGPKVKLQITAADTGYTLNQCGIFAQLGEDGEPTLLALFQREDGISIPSKDENPDFAFMFYACLPISNEGELTINVNANALVTHDDLEEGLKNKADLGPDGKVNPEQMPSMEGYIQDTDKGVAGGVASLDGTGKVPSEQLPEMNYDAAGAAAAVQKNLDTHIANQTNPHGVTKAQVGLGSVPNVATNDQTPTFTAATTLATLTSGEKLNVAFGKIAKAITDLINHIANKNNPHGVTTTQISAVPTSRTVNSKALSANISLTAADVGAVPTSRTVNSKALTANISLTAADVGASATGHKHAAGDITSGTLAVARGGTGQTTVDGIKTSLGVPTITSGTAAYTSGVTALANGAIYLQYE